MREMKTAMKHTKDLPKFSEVVQSKGAKIKNLGSRASVLVEWDLNQATKEGQVFRIQLTDKGTSLDAYISRQELEHYLRTI